MAVNTIYTGLKTGFQDLIDAVEKGESAESLEKKRNDIIDLTNVARQLNVLDHERAESLRKLEQVDIQNRMTRLNQLLELQKLVSESAIEELSKKFEAVKLGANLMETELLNKVALLKRENEEIRNRLSAFVVASKLEINLIVPRNFAFLLRLGA